MGNRGVACGKKVVYQIEIIRGNFFTCLFDLLIDTVETLADVANGGGVQVLLLGGHGVPLLRAFCLFFCRTDCICHCLFHNYSLKTTLALSDGLLKILFFIGQNIGIR